MAFKKHTGIGFPVPVLAQIKPKEFEILEKFEYRRTPDDEWTLVPKSDAYKFTDLASIPGVLLWLVPRFGRHTLAALLHDQLVKVLADRQETDSIFRDALGELKVPLLRRWIMWAGVSIGTVAARGVWGKVRIILWAILVVGAAAALWVRAPAFDWIDLPFLGVFGQSVWQDMAILVGASVVLLARKPLIDWLWLVLVGTLGVMLVILPLAFVGAATLVYLVGEGILRLAGLGASRIPGVELTGNRVIMSRAPVADGE